MLARILVALGGQVAEELVFGRDEVSSGATDDLRQATEMARYMVMQCGLSEAMGPYYVEDEKTLSEDMKQQLDAGGWDGVWRVGKMITMLQLELGR
jgi:ATP-dependent metalloprotease